MEKIELKHCMDLDANDPLRELRSEFLLAETGSIHFDANSMGAMPKTVPEKVAWMLNEGWRNLGRQGWSKFCLLYTSPSPRDRQKSRMPSSA